MNKKLRYCLEQKVRLVDELEQKQDMNIEEWSAHVHHWNKFMKKLRVVASTHSFRTKASERIFYEEIWIDTLTYYWYSREMVFFCNSLPIEDTQFEAYIDQKLKQYMTYRLQSFERYNAFCAQQLPIDYLALKMHVVENDERGEWAFFDERYPFLYNAYFGALERIINCLTGLLNLQEERETPILLTWNRSKQDFCLFVYALAHCNRINGEKVAVMVVVRELGQLFGLDVSKHFYQTLNKVKKRTDFSNNFLAEMNQVLVDMDLYNE